MQLDTIVHSDALDYLRTLPTNSVHCCITSPPYYGLRDYSTDGQIGLEDTPAQFAARLVEVFEEVRRVLRPDGTCWINLGDSYAGAGYSNNYNTNAATRAQGGKQSHSYGTGLKPKDLIGIPWRVAFALQATGWWLRSDIIWHKPNPMPESVTDRPTKAHEYVFLLAKSGTTQFWVHRDHNGQRTKPAPDYRWVHLDTGKETAINPGTKARWRRVNLWRGRDYWYDADAIRESGSANSHGGGERSQDRWHTQVHGETAYAGLAKTCPAGDNGRNKRTVWTVATEPSSLKHYAMFPQALIEPMILAGCPATVCSECGAGYVRVVERVSASAENEREFQGVPLYQANRGGRTQGPKKKGAVGTPAVTDHGYRPACICNAATSPGITLDPFMGTGTTALVAQKHGRHWLGCDVNAETVELANRRTVYHGEDKRMLKEHEAGVQQLDMFKG